MGKLAFLYPGQGSQKVGMCSDLIQHAPALFDHYFTQQEAQVGLPLIQYCQQGSSETLGQTNIAQPAIFLHSLALTDYAYQAGIQPDFVAGHSLGEYTAAVAAGTLSLSDGLHLVTQRGQIMYSIQHEHPGEMAAVIDMPYAKLQTLCTEIGRQHILALANWNTPTQIVVSGEQAGIQELTKVLRSRYNTRVIPLPVSGAFHSPLMQPVQSQLRAIMQELTWSDATMPLVSNVHATLLSTGDQIRQELLEQITGPVQWVACVETLINAGCDTFVELGSGQVLSKLVRAIAPDVRMFPASTIEKLRAFQDLWSGAHI